MKKPKIRAETIIIRSARSRAGINSDVELSKQMGLPYPTFRARLADPGSWRQYELKVLVEVTGMSDEDLLELVKGR